MYLRVLVLVPLQTDLYPYMKGSWNIRKKGFYSSVKFWGVDPQVKLSSGARADVKTIPVGLLVDIISLCRA